MANMIRVNISLDAESIRKLDECCVQFSENRSEFLRNQIALVYDKMNNNAELVSIMHQLQDLQSKLNSVF